jgi:serpin B
LAVNYGAGVQLTDLGSADSLSLINDYVSERTEKRVPQLFAQPLPSDTKMVLVNTVYVNSAWAAPFEKEATSDQSFAAPAGSKSVPFMHATESYRYVETDAASAVEIPLSIPDLALEIVLPTGDLAAFEAGLTGASLDQLLAGLEPTGLNLALPKFKLEPATDGSVMKPLQALGMKQAFLGTADFSGITDSFHLTIADVVHKTFFEIDEDGLEAAAVSAVIAVDESASFAETSMVVDRPFFVVLRDVQTRSVLFLGHVVDPSAQ